MKPHGHSPKARREARDRHQRIERQEKAAERRLPRKATVVLTTAGRCLQRDRFGHRCTERDAHAVCRAFGREWIAPEAAR